jgi:hypothetical protein
VVATDTTEGDADALPEFLAGDDEESAMSAEDEPQAAAAE